MSLPALPDGIPVFLFPLLVSELFCPTTPACLLALLTGHRQRVNEAMSLSLSLSLWPRVREFLSVNGLLAYLSLVNLPLSLSNPLPPHSTFSLVTLFKKLCFALRLRILMSFRLLRFFNFILKYHRFFFFLSFFHIVNARLAWYSIV